ncbi:hypothetical protein A3H03_02520 [Candidatus Kuenenbacteria bacterium RIFCSPLOWO2_12_FULL_42_13]|uniref:Peptidase M16 domain protein n=3 Tax=Candidatus Kueneniibacteriota TaxID=1752740 RepID=A0A0G1BUJ6_9BACT|nr:MAG: Peptidase M16 domain protein [Candidatus Kuenenbacteria bacterium GW2011_GWA2_42_15]OGG90339.1 MAG: hypothetical protein A3H55_00740 [Candidatus Kuenenbacteria bacterium RIFCSPLOWO2_02_FULL_42_16]OGG91470.1 MAG: hypothetical protein A3H03_02520 [Candidatus Kuenenbacteria bacterium RIFCSPLOWO2_12_FULL_42_13]
MYKLSVLKNGIKIITHNMPAAHGVTTGVFFGAGSRYEREKIAGASHFLEHMFFKGTKNRPEPSDIARSIEGVGGYLNAATSQDHTFYYNRVPKAHGKMAFEVLADMMNNSLFNEKALDRERGVILEELNMFLDTPMRYIYDLTMNLVFSGSTLGRDIIGAKKSILKIKRQDLIDYVKGFYQPQKMAIAIAGNINQHGAIREAEKFFGHLKKNKQPIYKKVPSERQGPGILIHNKKTDQAHLSLAVRALPYNHQELPTLTVLDTILGTGMSSRLFLNIREKLGLCYYINSSTEEFEDAGIFAINSGLNTDKIELAVARIWDELKKISTVLIAKRELDEAKEYLRGSISLEVDNTDNMAMWYGIQGLFAKKIKTPAEKVAELLKVSESDIMKLAKKLFKREQLNLAVIGPFQKRDKNRFLKLLK